MLEHGTTTAEAKTGYGLETETELRMLEALLTLDEQSPLQLAITFLGAHAIAPEYKDDPQSYTDHICKDMLPAVRDWWPENQELPFVDVFCETGAFDLANPRMAEGLDQMGMIDLRTLDRIVVAESSKAYLNRPWTRPTKRVSMPATSVSSAGSATRSWRSTRSSPTLTAWYPPCWRASITRSFSPTTSRR